MALTHRTAERLRRLAAEVESVHARLGEAGIREQDITKGARALWFAADKLDAYLKKARRPTTQPNRELSDSDG